MVRFSHQLPLRHTTPRGPTSSRSTILTTRSTLPNVANDTELHRILRSASLPAAILLVAILFMASACSKSAGEDSSDVTQTPAIPQVIIGNAVTDPDRRPKLGAWHATGMSLSMDGALSGTLVLTDTNPGPVAGDYPDMLFLWLTAEYLYPSHGDFASKRADVTPARPRHVDRSGAVFDLDTQLDMPPPSMDGGAERMPLESLHLELLWARAVRVRPASDPAQRPYLGLGLIEAGYSERAGGPPMLLLDAPAATLSGDLHIQAGTIAEEILDYLATQVPVITPTVGPPDYPPPPTFIPTLVPYPPDYPSR